MTNRIEIPNDWNPRRHQRRFWSFMQNGGKRAVCVWHRRAGKDSTSLNWTAKEVVQTPGVYWHLAPTTKQVRKIVWNNVDNQKRRIIDQVFPQALRKGQRDDEMSISFINGSFWQAAGSDNYDSLVGANPRGVVFSEYSLADPSAWDYIRPILQENNGWAIFIFTPRGPNHAKEMYDMSCLDDTWFSELLTVEDTGDIITQEQINQERREGVSEEIIEQEYYCSFSGIRDGSFYGRLMQQARNENRITKVPWTSDFPVSTAWDIGLNDETAIWFFQILPSHIRVIDYYENNGYGADHYAKIVKEKPYIYEKHYLPFDVKVREWGSGGQTRQQILRRLGIKATNVKKTSPLSRVEAARSVIPKCYFDAENCKTGIKALENYRKEYDEPNKVFKNNPVHDWASNGSDAFGTMSEQYKPFVDRGARQTMAIMD